MAALTNIGNGKVFCFGEFLLRMSPSLNRDWIHQSNIPVYLGGAELNVATALAKWKVPTKYCSALPGNYLSSEIIEELSAKNIDTSAMHIFGDRIGTYYLPQGTDLKNAGVIYDRANSSFADLKRGMIDWEHALDDCSWFHFSAISPALSEEIALVCEEGLLVAKRKGLKVSVDLNYRAKLWKYGKQPKEIMPKLVHHCDLIMGNIWAVESLLGIASPIQDSQDKTRDELLKACNETMLRLQNNFPNANALAFTFRLESHYWAVIKNENVAAISREYVLGMPKDKVGSGDCFMAGLIFGFYNGQPIQHIIDFAAAAAVGKLQEIGDGTNQTIEDVQQLISS